MPRGPRFGDHELRDAPLPGDWATRAACRGRRTEAFFPPRGAQGVPRWLVELCERCPVAEECLDYALRHPVLGLWSGTSEDQRRRWHRAQRRARKKAS